MKKIIFALIFFASTTVFAQAAPFRGYYTLEQTVSERLFAPGAHFNLEQYTSDRGLLYLLGYWDFELTPRGYKNGEANALNMLIYYTALSAFAEDLAADCQAPKKLQLNSEFANALDTVCEATPTDETLMPFWLALMGYDAPEEEYQAWRDFVVETYNGAAPSERVRAMALSIFMNPYFLVKD